MNIKHNTLIRYISGVVVLFMIISGCSTKKNTLLTRNYHNLTSHYNIYFNAYETFNEGLKKVELSYRDNFNQIIPINVYSKEEAARRLMSDMEKTKKKCSKLITTHSIKANPKIRGGARNERQKSFLRKNEYNKWIDDSYLLLGKAYYHQHDFFPAMQNFEYVIRQYPDDGLRQQATLWLAKSHLELKDYSQAKEILDRLTAEPELEKDLRDDLYALIADWHLRQEQYSEAIDFLTRANELTSSKKLRTRYNYILGQLFEEEEDFTQASIKYGEVLDLNPGYEMAFNAKINRAKLFQGNSDDGKEIRKQLLKMLKDDKNLDFLDQIYYALAELDIKEGKKEDAIENYRLSALYSYSNNYQKTLSYLALGNLHYTDRDYIESGAFYDSCVISMPEDFPDAEEIRNHSFGLSLLAENLKVIKIDDSLLQLAAMPQAELDQLITEKIEEARKIEEERKRMEEEERFNQRSGSYQRYGQGGSLSRAPGSMSMGGGMQGSQFGTAVSSNDMGGGSGQWYFYNPTTISFGQSEFSKRFGRRKLEDNWRRSNKNIASATSDISTQGEEGNIESVISASKSKSFQPTTREYYTADIPFSDSAKLESHKRIETAFFNVGKIFADELDKPEESIDYFLELNERYPETERLLFSYYNLYQLYKKLPDSEQETIYKNYILDQFPDSKSAMIIRNPNYFQEIEEAKMEVKEYYTQTYEAYLDKQYDKVLQNSLFADTGFMLNPIRDKFGLLLVMAKAKLDPDNTKLLKDDLNSLVFKFPESEVADPARNLLNYLENGPSDSIKSGSKQAGLQIGAITQNEDIEGEADYVYTENTAHYYIVISSSATTDVNRLKYNISSFNVENYDQDFFEVQSEVLTQNLIMISVKNFPDAKSGMDYYKSLLADMTVYADYNETDFRHFIISKANYNIFYKNKNVFNYIRFFNDNYLGGDK